MNVRFYLKAGCSLTGWVTINVSRNSLPHGVGYLVIQSVFMTCLRVPLTKNCVKFIKKKRKFRPYLFYKKASFWLSLHIYHGRGNATSSDVANAEISEQWAHLTRKQLSMSMYSVSVYHTRESWARHFMIHCKALDFYWCVVLSDMWSNMSLC